MSQEWEKHDYVMRTREREQTTLGFSDVTTPEIFGIRMLSVQNEPRY